ncbi:unnamed protein product [Adineta ricciae]|uniref:RING-type domain-containing protein n=1 Tax=Adineta ricciae TaxID=249248 RepID=A0A815TD17_ADIRI|nr:unnamed protein product [Adineta ricciae]
MKAFFRLSWWSNQVAATIVVFVYFAIFCHFGWNRIHPTLYGLVLGAVVLHTVISFPPDEMCKALDGLWANCIDSDCCLISVIALRYSLTHPVQFCDPAPYVLIDEPPLSNLSSQRTRMLAFLGNIVYLKFSSKLIMNDEWSRCPICFEDYTLEHRPTTFTCGHSTCIDHTVGTKRLRNCPICRCSLESVTEYHVSYNLEEAARLFQAIKNNVDWSTIKLPTATASRDNAAEMIHRDELYARRLQAELLHGRERAVVIDPTPQASQAASAQNQPVGYLKNCGHRCDLRTTQRCCTCSDRRPRRQGNTYETYVDGRGVVNSAARNEFYCSTCKRQ